METQQLLNHLDDFDESPTRLEGMETQFVLPEFLKDGCLRPALRGWKHIKDGDRSRNDASLRPALRGWKRTTIRARNATGMSLRPALRGWKRLLGLNWME